MPVGPLHITLTSAELDDRIRELIAAGATTLIAAEWRDPSDPDGTTIRIDPTGSVDSTLGWAALIAEYTDSGVPVILDHPPGTYVGSVANISVGTIGFLGPGSHLMSITAPSGFAGDVFSAIPTAFDAAARTSPAIGGFSIYGEDTAAGACGFHHGPWTGQTLDDITVLNFDKVSGVLPMTTQTRSKNYWFDLTNPFYAAGNNGAYAWTERMQARRLHSSNGADHVVFDGGGGGGSQYKSFDYSDWWFTFGGWKVGQRGIVLRGKIQLGGVQLTLYANCDNVGGANVAGEGLIVFEAFSQIDRAELHITAEQFSGTEIPCLNLDATSIFAGNGVMSFLGLGDADTNGTTPRISGWMQTPGIAGVTNSYLLSRKVPPVHVDSGFWQTSAAGSFKGVPAPTAGGDPPRTQDVPSLPPVKAVATTALSLSGLPLIGSYQTAGGDRVLLTAESGAANNGPWLIPTVNGTLSSNLSTGGAITALPVTATTVAIAANTSVTLDDGTHTQVVTVSATAAVGATSLTVLSFTPNFAYTTGATTVRFPWSRPIDFPSGSTNNGRTVLSGDGSLWGLVTTGTITVDTTAQVWKLLAGRTTYDANHRTTDSAGIGTTPVVVLTTASLAVGTWKIDAHVQVEQNGSPTTPKTVAALGAGTATATFDGASSAEIMQNSTTLFEGTVHITAVAVITVAGTLTISVTCSSATCTAKAATTSTSTAGATGYVATRLA